MSKDLNAKNNLADTSRGFEKDWPLSNNDAKLTKKQFDQKALDNFFENWMKTWPNRAHFWTGSNKAKLQSLFPEKSLTWEAKIYHAFDEAAQAQSM